MNTENGWNIYWWGIRRQWKSSLIRGHSQGPYLHLNTFSCCLNITAISYKAGNTDTSSQLLTLRSTSTPGQWPTEASFTAHSPLRHNGHFPVCSTPAPTAVPLRCTRATGISFLEDGLIQAPAPSKGWLSEVLIFLYQEDLTSKKTDRQGQRKVTFRCFTGDPTAIWMHCPSHAILGSLSSRFLGILLESQNFLQDKGWSLQ